MATEYVISIKVQGSESASGPLGAVGGALGRIAEFVTAGIIFRGLERIGEGLQSAAGAGWNAATSFETVMSRIKGLTTTPAADIAKMSADVIRLSKMLNLSATELGEGEYFIASSGFAGAQATDILTVSAKAASAGLGQTKVIADAVTSALNAYKLKAGDAARITDVLTRAVIEGKGEPDALAGAIARVLPIAAQAGVGFEQVMASLATMTRTGLSAEEAATALRGTLGALLAPGKQAKDALASIGWSADGVRQAIREKGLLAALEELMQRTGGNIETLDLIIPNIRALTGVLSTAGSQGQAYATILASMGKASGSVDTAFAASAGTWEFQFGRFKNVLLAMPIELGEKMLPGLTGILDGITKDIEGKTGGWADLAAGWLGPVIGRLQAAAKEGGIQGVIAEIGKMINEGWTLYVQPELQEWVGKFWEWVNGENGVAGAVPGTLGSLLTAIGNFMRTEWDSRIKPALDEWANKAWDWVTDPKSGALVRTAEALNQLAGRIEAWVADPATQATLAQLGEQMGDALADGLINLAKNSPKVAEFVGELLKSLWKAGSSMNLSFQSVGDTLAVNLVDGFIQKIIGKETGGKFKEAIGGMLKWLAPLAMGPAAPVGYMGLALNQLRQGAGGNTTNRTTNQQTIYGGVNVFGASDLQKLLASLVP